MSVEKRVFGNLATGEAVYLYQIKNKNGAYIEVSDYGAEIVSVYVKDKEGNLRDVVLGYDSVEGYERNGCYFGACIGRSGNRIENASFEINGKQFQMMKNENENNLHSGPDGYHQKIWQVAEVTEDSVAFYRESPDGEQGFPGNFKITVTYCFTDEQELIITYQGESDQDTVANMTNHSYFNLNGIGNGTVLNQKLQIHAASYTPVKDSASIPTGEEEPVEGTPMDFREFKAIGEEIEADYAQLKYTGGYDHNYVTDHYKKGEVREIARAYAEESGIMMTVCSDLPGVQFYAGNFISEEECKNGYIAGKRTGFCLETQYAPNAINQKNFVSPLLKAKEMYKTITSYTFAVL